MSKKRRNPFFMRSSVVRQMRRQWKGEIMSQSLLYEVFCCSVLIAAAPVAIGSQSLLYEVFCCSYGESNIWLYMGSQSLLYEVFCCSEQMQEFQVWLCRNPFFMRSSVVRVWRTGWVYRPSRNPFFMRSSVVLYGDYSKGHKWLSQSLLYEVFCCSELPDRLMLQW